MSVPEEGNLVGSIVGSFRIARMLGRGGMGSVYLGEHTIIGSRVAIKVLHPKLAADENLVARFYAEARAVNLAGHENIVNIFDMTVVPPNRYCLVMEYLEGKQLNSLLTGPVPTEVAVPILLQVCDALQAAHDASIVHRDLKPENIFLVKRGKRDNFVKVLDFGLAKLLDSELAAQQTQAGLLVGTPEFMSPEQANSTPVDGRADIYALGCIAWLMATGKLPFPQRGLTDLLVAHKQATPQPPHIVNPSVPPMLSAAILRAMAKRPGDRFQSAAEFSEALQKVLDQPPAPPKMTPQAVEVMRAPAPGVAPVAPRHEVRFDAVVTGVDGKTWGRLPCKDISRGGMFVCSAGPTPANFSRVKVMLPDVGNLELMAEVVRHVAPDQAKAWGMEPGFGLQFIDVTPTVREALNRLIQGLSSTKAPEVAAKALSGDVLNVPAPPKVAPMAPPKISPADDAEVEKLLGVYRGRIAGDHYQMLNVSPDVDFGDLKSRARDAGKELEAAGKRPVSDNQRAQLEAALARVKTAYEVLSGTQTRAAYDANRGNFKGVGRCIAAGLSVLDIERVRAAFLNNHPGAAGSAHVKLLASKAYEGQGDYKNAIDACESALGHDPLNLQMHQRHAYLVKLLKEAR